MNTTFTLTANELRAALVLVKSCLDGMGGKRPSDLDNDPYTWVSANDLMAAGWNKNEAAGTFGALLDKGMVQHVDRNEWCLSEAGYRYLDTVWDAQTTPAEKENTVTTEATTPIIALIDLSNMTVEFAATEAAADASDLYTAGSAPELEDLTGPQSVAVYNTLANLLNSIPRRSHLDPIQTTKRFADKGTATKRVWGLIEQLHAEEVGAKAHGEAAPTVKPEVLTSKDKAEIAAAKNIPAPAKVTTAPRRGTGINLAPLAKAYPCREGSKQATLVDMLNRPQGATMEELVVALSGGAKPWKEVTVKSGLNWDMNKIKGYGIRTTKRGDQDCYHLVLPAGLAAPIPHTPKKGA